MSRQNPRFLILFFKSISGNKRWKVKIKKSKMSESVTALHIKTKLSCLSVKTKFAMGKAYKINEINTINIRLVNYFTFVLYCHITNYTFIAKAFTA